MFSFVFFIISSFIFSYLIGSIPTGFWFAKYFFNIDVTKYGSKNIGATNVARVLGSKKYFFLIFFLDFLKAFLCLFLVNKLFCFFYQTNIDLILIFNAIFLLIGNACSIFLDFIKGGKGVATTLGILAFLFPVKLFVIFICFWILILLFAKRVDVASLISSYLITIVYFFYFNHSQNYSYFLIFLCFWVSIRHKDNIKSLLFH